MEKEYEINGVCEYAHCFSFTVTANNKEEVKEKAEIEIDSYINSDNAEYTGCIMDEPERI